MTVDQNDGVTFVLATSFMMAEAELNELHRPYDTLKAIGYSTDEAKAFVASIENAAQNQTIPEPKSESDKVVNRAQRSEPERSAFRGFMLVAWGYLFAVWLYVVAMQLFYPESIYGALAIWLPFRLDYFGETAFVFSFIIATAFILSKPKLNLRSGRQTKTNLTASP
ncbi:MAG: hypothetical protein ACLP5V_06375 [Candidatus Bathyarchaeia archaeon]